MRRNIFSSWFTILIILVVAVPVLGQYDIATYNDIKDEYPENNIIILKKKVHINIDANNYTPEIELKNEERILYLKNTKGMDPKHATYTSSFNELIDFEANSYVLDNEKYKRIPVKDYKEVKKFGNGVFFDDNKEIVFTYPGVSEGSVIELNTIHKLHEPRFLGIYFLNEYYPVHEFELVAEVDADITLDFVSYNIPEENLKIDKISKRNKNIYTIRLTKMKNLRFEDFQPDRRYFAPHIVPVIRSISGKDGEQKLLSSPADLYQWYSGFIRNIYDGVDDSGLKRIVSQTITSDMTEQEKVEKLYHWVQQNIKYIAFEDGMGGFVPRKPDDVLNKRYGDCKDKTSILHALLKEAGIASYYTWVGTRDIPYTYQEICSPAVDNHMILTYRNGEDYYFLDGTGSYQPLDMTTSFIQGKEVLIGIDADNYEIREVPIISAEQNRITDNVALRLNDESLSGKGNISVHGLPKIGWQYRLETDDKKEQKKSLEAHLEKGNNKFVLTSYSINQNERFAKNLNIDYDFTLGDYIQQVGTEIYLNLNLDQKLLDFKIEDERENPVEFETTRMQENIYSFYLPEGASVTYVPETVEYKSPEFNFSIKYRVEEDRIIYTHNYSVNTLMLESESAYAEWREFISLLESAYKETLVIEVNQL